MKPRILVAFLIHFTIALPLAVEAQQVIFLARHAEQAPEVEEPPLTEKGQQRARTLAAILKDAGINVIYTNPRLRSIQTAEPLAKMLKVESKVVTVRGDDVEGLIHVLRKHPQDRVLIVTGSLNIPHVLKALGHPLEITVPPTEYDNLFVIFPKTDARPVVLRLRY